jgi:hypothetical protein
MSRHKFTLTWLALSLVLVGLLVAGTAARTAQAQGGMITGTVTSPGGYPLPDGTLVKLFEPGDWDVFGQAIPDANDGSFSLGPVPNGLYVIKAVPPASSGYTQSEIKMLSILNSSVDVGELALTTPQIFGTVVAPDGVTLADAWVKVYAGDDTLLQGVDAEGGHFVVGGLASGGYGLLASPASDDPYWDSARETVNVAGTASIPVTLTLTMADIYGVAQDELAHSIPLATVYAIERGSGHRVQADQSNANGHYAIGGLEPGDYLLGAWPPFSIGGLLPPRPISVTVPSATNPYTLTFGSAPKIVTGTVETHTRIPVQAAQVIAHRVDKSGRVSTLSQADGGYRLDLTPGLWALTVRPISVTNPAHWVYNKPPQLIHFQHNLLPEHKAQDFVVLTADANVTGTVLLPDGSTELEVGSPPTFTVTVALHDDEGIVVRGLVSTTNGSFDIPLPHGGYKVWIKPHDPSYMGPMVAPILVPPSSTISLGTLYLLEKNAAITGTVTDEGGIGAGGIPVSAWRPGAPGGAETRTGSDGQYVLSVVAGDWHVQPSPGPAQPYLYTDTGTRVSVGVSETITNVNFALTTADATINGVLVKENGDLASDAHGWASATDPLSTTLHNGAPIQAGTFAIHVPGGHTYAVAAHLPAGGPYMSAGERNVSVRVSETQTITLTVKEKDATIDGALWDPRNQDVVEGVNGLIGAWDGGNWAGTHINSGNGTYRFDVAAGLWHLGYRIDPDAGYVKLVHHKNVPVASGQTAHVPLPVAPKDGAIAGVVLGPGGDPLAGATIVADGVGPDISHIWLTTHSKPDGSFRLAVPHGAYHLGATIGVTTSIKPAIKRVVVPAGGVSGGHVLQFQTPDATISGALTISGTSHITDSVLVWAWSDDDGFVKARFPVTNSTGLYSLDVLSNTTWHLGAVYETPAYYWVSRAEVTLGASGATQDLVLSGPHPKPGPVAVTFDASQAQRILLADGTHIFIPAGAMPVEGQVTLHVVPIATLPHQRHANVFKYGYAFTAVDNAGEPITEHFNQDVVIGFPYDEAELRRLGLVEHFLKPAYFATTTNQWTFPESYAVDYAHDVVVMQIDHFTDFALTGEAGFEVFLPLMARIQ